MEKRKRTRIAAYALLTREKEILLCRISKQLPRWEGLWTLPGGGIEFGEDPESAVKREVKEETGLTIETRSVAFVDSIFEEREDEAFQGFRIVYYADIKEGALKHEKSGSTDLCCWHNTTIDKDLLVDLAAAGLDHLATNKHKPN